MSGLRLLSHGVIAIWLLVAAVWGSPEGQAVRLRAVARPHASPPAPAPPQDFERAPARPPRDEDPAPPEASQTAPHTTPISQADRVRGEGLLSMQGAFPMIEMRYDALRSFRRYALAMQTRGARFVVVRRRRIVGSVDLASAAIREEVPQGDFSPRARDYAGEPVLAAIARRARERFGEGASVMMLVPRSLDAGLFGGVARVLAERGESHRAFRNLEGRYVEAAGGGLHFELDSGERLDGSRVLLGLGFDIDALVGEGA